jgi:hypothetical protein
VNITITDLAGAQDHHNFTLTVVNVNDPPTITSLPPITINVSQEYRYQIVAVDIDVGDVLNYSLEQKPTGMLINSTGALRWTPTKDQVRTHPIKIKVSDGKAEVFQSFNITVILPNHPPRIDPMQNVTIKVGTKWIRAVVAHEDDTEDVLTYKLDSNLTGMTISSTGEIRWTPVKSQVGTHKIKVTVSDGKAQVSSEFTITVTKRTTTTASSPWWLFLLIIVIVIACVVGVILVLWKKRKGKTPTTLPGQ